MAQIMDHGERQRLGLNEDGTPDMQLFQYMCTCIRCGVTELGSYQVASKHGTLCVKCHNLDPKYRPANPPPLRAAVTAAVAAREAEAEAEAAVATAMDDLRLTPRTRPRSA